MKNTKNKCRVLTKRKQVNDKKEVILKQRFISIIGILVLAGCASNSKFSKIETIESNLPIYATLAMDEKNKFYFEKFSYSSIPNSINLNNLTHNFPTQDGICAKHLVERNSEVNRNLNNKILCDTDLQFRSATVSTGAIIGNTIGNAYAALASMGIGVSAYYGVEFDTEEYEDALSQALAKVNRVTIINDANQLFYETNSSLQLSKIKFEEMRNKLQSKLGKSIKINDTSKLFAKNEIVHIEKTSSMPPISRNVIWQDNNELKIYLLKKLDESRSEGKLTLQCSRLKSFHFSTEGCEQSWDYDSKHTIDPITYNVKSANQYVFEPHFDMNDSNIAIRLTSNGYLKVENRTNSFITINSLSLYFGADIETDSNINLEIPPSATSSNMSIHSFNIYDKNRKLKNIKKENLEKELSLGLALKYKVLNTNKENTLYDTNIYKYSEFSGQVI
ncbi:hypothetical protein AB4160_05380 [Shewanella sp. 10N.286.51.B8]|uniref:hypothetical protein n=1 Tax=Shewanella sp. 10N.286.51.B8 TaxID=3229708 RepID=UPI0035502539